MKYELRAKKTPRFILHLTYRFQYNKVIFDKINIPIVILPNGLLILTYKIIQFAGNQMNEFQHVFKALNSAFPKAIIKINGFTELEDHYRPKGKTGNYLKIDITSDLFDGKTLLEQHKMVHNPLHDLMQINGGFIHAVTIKTRREQE